MKPGINQVHCTVEFALVNKIATVSHPERITHHVATDIYNRAAHCNLNLFYFIENKQSKFLVKTIEHHHLTKRCARFIAMLLLRHL